MLTCLRDLKPTRNGCFPYGFLVKTLRFLDFNRKISPDTIPIHPCWFLIGKSSNVWLGQYPYKTILFVVGLGMVCRAEGFVQ